ncbi:hypothetical protein C7974DRAFT_421330 [Boeremia exigua]|uniref:uncharacterized protein n=1 Tax=Boeremia exigua TaxID=749465 RepID=UPI001E8E01B7|nr:uncharacterized protein C7974DRAFT_421330 [Boeremia exigua]KAH6643167.1 hypothetical protein C7974DRAFT_421330 [Boeremia exigua]
MKANFLALGLFGLAGASAVLPREDKSYQPEKKYDSYEPEKYDSYEPEKKYESYEPEKKYEEKKYKSYEPEKKYEEYPKKEYKEYPEKKPKKYGSYKDDYPVNDEYADEHDYEDGYDYKNQKGYESTWKPKSKSPEFFNLRIDEKCDVGQLPSACPFNGYAIRLEGGIFIATPYNKWWDPKLPTFFVDDDTQLYTVSKDPLQVYIDGITGALKYTKIGWLPPNAIAISFYHTGNNPLGIVGPSPSQLSWPSTVGASFFGYPWTLCPLGSTKQYQVFINGENFGMGGPAGITKDTYKCAARNLAAVNANPWKQDSSPAYYPQPY